MLNLNVSAPYYLKFLCVSYLLHERQSWKDYDINCRLNSRKLIFIAVKSNDSNAYL
jgi:hypothetical protein